jgi:tetratricopeptide (TPR) repeat protein
MTNHNITPEELAYIERYLQQELTDEELAGFRQRLANEPVLQEKVDDVRLLLLGIAEAGMEEKLNEFHQRLPVSLAPVRSRSTVLRYFAVAASVALLLSVSLWYFLMKSDKQTDLYAKYYQPDPGLMTVMSSTDNYDFEKAMVAYRNGEYQQAINAWKQQWNKRPDSDTLSYFLGAAYQANGKTDSAKIYLSKIAAQTESSFYKDANWYIGLIYLQMNQRNEALPHLKLSAHQKAQALITELEK